MVVKMGLETDIRYLEQKQLNIYDLYWLAIST